MGLEQVIGDVRRDGEQRAERIIDEAEVEAKRILDDAREQAREYEEKRLAQAGRDADQVRAQVRSHGRFEARKVVLGAEAELRDELRQAILDGFSALDAKVREGHIKKLLATAKKTIPSGTVTGAKQDESVLKAQDTYDHGGTADILGGIIVESEDGRNRLDMSYESLIADRWRDILTQESELFG